LALSCFVQRKREVQNERRFPDKKEAELAAAELEKQLHKGYDINAGDQLFPEYMRNWFELYKKGKHSKEHDKNVELSVKLVEQYFQVVKLKELTRDMYQKFINEIAENRATETVKKRHTYIKECIKAAIEEGIITRDPTYKIVVKGKKKGKEKKGKDEELKYLNYEEAKKLIAEIKKDMRPKYISRYIVLFALATGARFSEIIGLTWDCVDFKNRLITINKTWDYKYTNDFADTKTYSSKRTIKIDVDTCKMLKELKKAQNETAIKTGLRNEKNLVFVNTKMELVSNNAVNKTLKMLCRKLGLKEVTMHSLRHTHASMLLYRKANIKYISKRLGHKDIGIRTSGKYTSR
jgi:integrase